MGGGDTQVTLTLPTLRVTQKNERAHLRRALPRQHETAPVPRDVARTRTRRAQPTATSRTIRPSIPSTFVDA
jgi:hypothetical protein